MRKFEGYCSGSSVELAEAMEEIILQTAPEITCKHRFPAWDAVLEQLGGESMRIPHGEAGWKKRPKSIQHEAFSSLYGRWSSFGRAYLASGA